MTGGQRVRDGLPERFVDGVWRVECQTPPQLHPGPPAAAPLAVLALSTTTGKLPRHVCLECALRYARQVVADAYQDHVVNPPGDVHTLTMGPVIR